MVSWTGHIVPVLVTVVIWFVATGLVAWLDNLERRTFPLSLKLAALGGIAGFCMAVWAMDFTSHAAVYAAFCGALLIWTWHELGFLTGAVAGPRRIPCPKGADGWERFSLATATVIHHEIALALTALLLLSISWNAPNAVAAMTFAVLYFMRLSTKLNIFYGVPNASTDILPPHLNYLKSYFGPTRLGWPLIASLVASLALAIWLGMAAYAAPSASAEAAGASLLFAFAALGVLEHLFLALPIRDGALWGWALPGARKAKLTREILLAREDI